MLLERLNLLMRNLDVNFLTDPYFWAFFSLAGLFFWVVLTSFRIGPYRKYFDLLAIFIFVAGQLMLVMPTTDGQRLGWGAWRLAPGLLFWVLTAAQSITACLYMRALFDPRQQTAYTRLLLRTGSLYSMIRYPFFVAGLLFTIGAAINFNSLIGLVLQPVWWAAFLLLLRVEARQLRRDLGGYFEQYEKRLFTTLRPWKAMLDLRELPAYPFTNLVFKGGGVRGVAYIGVMQALEERGILPQVQRVAGTSAGAIVATFAAMRIPHTRWADILRTMDLSTIMNRDGARIRFHNLARLESEFGMFSTEPFYDWFQGIIAEHCGGNGLATFRDFHQRGFLDLAVVASNLSTRQEKVFSYAETPDCPVADAVRMSICIPVYFSVLRHDGQQFGKGDLYVDGGLYNNFPIHLFDAPDFGARNPWYLNGINWQTLGFYLYPETDKQSHRTEIRHIFDYASMMFDNVLLATETRALEASTVDQRRAVKINDLGISSTDFHAAQPSPEYEGLVRSGYESTLQFLDHYQLPVETTQI